LKTFFAFLLLLIAAAAQTTLKSPVTITIPSGSSPTTQQDFVPATAAFPCLTLAKSPSTIPGTYRICGQNKSITMDFGNGYVSLKGAQGPPGPTGATGPTGAAGPQGPPGAIWKTCTATITNFSFSGGTATGTLTVSGCQ
jgi:hypothetical protein